MLNKVLLVSGVCVLGSVRVGSLVDQYFRSRETRDIWRALDYSAIFMGLKASLRWSHMTWYYFSLFSIQSIFRIMWLIGYREGQIIFPLKDKPYFYDLSFVKILGPESMAFSCFVVFKVFYRLRKGKNIISGILKNLSISRTIFSGRSFFLSSNVIYYSWSILYT